ncbi:hypothetical protein [Amycolatopsis sp.]|uniref:hypothetical protein n=1 Tax=Amycolatopsis sp. TaxID=37632 RepID=UPI002D7F26AF|nr:hypothetical protein [Amycolatopsis sp.]HET6711326.1 hypothetical protein [Amycolatopsis sp.]
MAAVGLVVLLVLEAALLVAARVPRRAAVCVADCRSGVAAAARSAVLALVCREGAAAHRRSAGCVREAARRRAAVWVRSERVLAAACRSRAAQSLPGPGLPGLGLLDRSRRVRSAERLRAADLEPVVQVAAGPGRWVPVPAV